MLASNTVDGPNHAANALLSTKVEAIYMLRIRTQMEATTLEYGRLTLKIGQNVMVEKLLVLKLIT